MAPEFRQSIPDNFRALMTALEKEFGLELSIEIVYDMCPVCYFVYRNTESESELESEPSANLQECPKCSTSRFKDTGAKRVPHMQVGHCRVGRNLLWHSTAAAGLILGVTSISMCVQLCART